MPDDDRNQDQSASPSQWEPPPAVGELPDRLRVHSLARVLGTTSKRVLDALAGLDGRSRSPQSSVEQAEAIRVRDVLAAAEIASAQATADLLAETEAETEVASPEAETEVASPEAELVTQLTFIDPTAAVIIEAEPESRLILEDHSAASHAAEAVDQPAYMPLFVAPQPVVAVAVDIDDDDDAFDGEDESDEADGDAADRPANRRRRRGRRGRGRGRGEQAGGEGDDT